MTRAGIRLWLLLLVLMGLAAVPGAEERDGPYLSPAERDAFLEGLEDRLGSITSVHVRFRQERNLSLFFEPVVSEGVLAFVRPDRLHWEWVTPYPSLLVLNRGRIERFDVEDGELRQLRAAGEDVLRSVALQMTRWLQGRFRDSNEMFTIEVAPGERPRIVLVTRSEGLRESLERVEVELDRGVERVVAVHLVAPNGETTVMSFFDERRDVELEHALFDLDAPGLVGAAADGTYEP